MVNIAKGICTDTYHTNSTFLCFETSTKVFMNRCRGGHQGVGKSQMMWIRKIYHQRVHLLVPEIFND